MNAGGQAYRIALLPGDGIGGEVLDAAVRVLNALPLTWEWHTGEIGWGAYQRHGDPLPEETLRLVQQCDAALFGAVSTPPGGASPPNVPAYRSPVVRLRQELDLYANIRPCRSIPHPLSRQGVNLVIVRENTEDAYTGKETLSADGETALGEIRITRHASQRITRAACQQAVKHGLKRVTVVHKANILRQTSGLFRRTALETAAAEFPDLSVDDMLVDTCAMELVRAPEQFGVIVTTNLFGDILSDEASALVGGLGLACSANLGERAAVFEPVHGSAPALAGRGIANPLAMIGSAALMLEHLGEADWAARLESAIRRVIRTGRVTPDLGGNLSTLQTAEAVIQALQSHSGEEN
ncbi:MAG: 3-isopropylmalate dehydrogenase [Bellilinea sp.]|nr:MAG: 3-isopropylmalate dehydrogenase [Bellilinea sp.]